MAEDQAFFDQPQRGVRRDTLVREIDISETAQISKMASDTMCQAFCEGVFGAFVLSTIIQDEQPAEVHDYLVWWLIINGTFGVLKLIMFTLTAHKRRLKTSQIYKLALQFLQGIANVILFILSYTVWDNIQYWFWEQAADQQFYVTMTAICLGLVEYYYLFLTATWAILGTIFGGFWLCSLGERGHNADHNEPNGQSQQSRLQRQETSQTLGQLSRLFDWSKFTEHEECVICLMPFTAEDMVTPLPCDKRHYFHSNCIEEWSQNHNDCPLCKKTFNAQDLAEALNRRSFIEPSGGNTANDPDQYMVNDTHNAPLIQDA